MYLEKLEQPCKKAVLMLLFPKEIQRIKWKNGHFLIWSQIIVLNLVGLMFVGHYKLIIFLVSVSAS